MSEKIYLIGLPGCGKTWLGTQLAECLARPFIDLDACIEARLGMRISTCFEEYGERYFREREREALFACGDSENAAVISTGGGIVLDAANVVTMRETGRVLFLDRPVEAILGDLISEHRPLLAGKPEALYALEKSRRALYEAACHVRIENRGDAQDVLARLVACTR